MLAVVTRRPDGAPHQATFRLGDLAFPCAIGAAGLVASKEEGDGGTPVGTLALRRLLFRADRVSPPPQTEATLPREPLAPDDGWCDDAADPAYNRPVRLPHGAHAERLWRDDALYDLVGVLGWNDDPVRRGRGSAIFLHVATPDLAPTAGCVALARPHLLEVLARGLDAIRTDPG